MFDDDRIISGIEAIVSTAAQITDHQHTEYDFTHLFAPNLRLTYYKKTCLLNYRNNPGTSYREIELYNNDIDRYKNNDYNKILIDNFKRINDVGAFEDSVYEILAIINFIDNPCCPSARDMVLSMKYLWNWSFLKNLRNTRCWCVLLNVTELTTEERIQDCVLCGKTLPNFSVVQNLVHSHEPRFRALARI